MLLYKIYVSFVFGELFFFEERYLTQSMLIVEEGEVIGGSMFTINLN